MCIFKVPGRRRGFCALCSQLKCMSYFCAYHQSQELDVDNLLYLYTLYVVKGRTVTPLLHKLFLGELHRYYSGNYLVRIQFE